MEEIHRKLHERKTIGSVNLSSDHALLIHNLPPPPQPNNRNGSVEKTGSTNRQGSHASHANLITSQANGTGSSEREGSTNGKGSHFRHANLIISHASDIVKLENDEKKPKETTNRKGSDLRHANLIISHPSDNVKPENYEKKTKVTQETKTEFLLSGSPLDIDSMKTNLSDFIYKFINPDITGIQENKEKKEKWIEPLDRFFVKSFINQFITPGSLKVIRRQDGNEKGGKNATEAFKSKLNKFISQFIRPPSTLKNENNEVPSVRKSVEAKVDKFFKQLISPTLTFNNQSKKHPNKSDQTKTKIKTKTTTFIDELVEEYDLMNELLKANNDLEERQRVQML